MTGTNHDNAAADPTAGASDPSGPSAGAPRGRHAHPQPRPLAGELTRLYTVSVEGCDSQTDVKIHLNASELETLTKLASMLRLESTYACMPTMKIIDSEGNRQDWVEDEADD